MSCPIDDEGFQASKDQSVMSQSHCCLEIKAYAKAKATELGFL
jgi:hypothetical protein